MRRTAHIFQIMDKRKRRVVILGGGFGGLETAKALAGVDAEVLVIDKHNYHLFQPLLYQVAMAGLSPAEIASPIRNVLADQKNTRVILGEVDRVDLDARTVFMGEARVPYDHLVIAVGARNAFFGHDEWEKAAPGLKGLADALEIRRRVLTAFESAEREPDPEKRKDLLRFAVIGGGPTGVEMSGAIAELSRFVLAKDFRNVDPRDAQVVLIEAAPRILNMFTPDLAQKGVDQLNELGVEVHAGMRVVGIDHTGVSVETSDGVKKHIPASTVLWSAGVRANEVTNHVGVPVDGSGRLIVGSDCALPGHPEAFAIGDAAHFEENGEILPGVSPTAMQQGRYVAKIIAKELAGSAGASSTRKPFKYHDKGSMATIGRSRALAQAGKIKLSGFVAWLAWLFIHVLYLVGFRNRYLVLFNWTWSYLSYGRGARLITETGWHTNEAAEDAAPLPVTRTPELPPAPLAALDGRTAVDTATAVPASVAHAG